MSSFGYRDFREAEREARAEKKAATPNDIPTHDSVALSFATERGDDLKFCYSSGSWYRWTGVMWVRDDTRLTLHLIREFCRRLSDDQDANKRSKMQSKAFADAVESFAKVDPRVGVTADFWDRDPLLLGTPGGTLDLTTGELRPPERSDCITKSTRVTPLPNPCPRWLQFLEETTGGDAELIRFLQQWCGYALTGSTREHALAFVYGPGGNGKSVFLNIIADILHDYATTAAMDTFTASKSERHPTDLAMLRGARLVTASETEEGRAWAESRIKQLTGGDKISARFMRQDFFEYVPQFKLMIVGNHKPVLHSVDEAARRRFSIIPFIRKPEAPDRELEKKLKQEAEGILHWMIAGCLDWQANGLVQPPSVRAATEQYFADQDVFGQWLDECCEDGRGNDRIWDTASIYLRAGPNTPRRPASHPANREALRRLCGGEALSLTGRRGEPAPTDLSE
jgi:putative DNA primase/helicase